MRALNEIVEMNKKAEEKELGILAGGPTRDKTPLDGQVAYNQGCADGYSKGFRDGLDNVPVDERSA